MGLLTCNRVDCENIMCVRYSDEYGYICDYCFGELDDARRQDPSLSIGEFMRTPPKRNWFSPHDNEDIYDVFKISE
jgi:hypothetical protein